MDKCKHLIIGAGPAALAAAQAIRNISKTAEITLINREELPPYSPTVLPYLFSGELTESGLFKKGNEFIKNMKINLVRGKEVVEVLPETNEIEYKSGERETYDKLLIATGASPKVPPVKNLESDQYYTFRTYSDFQRFSRTLNTKQEIAIYGAGLVAVELAEKLCLAGHSVTIIVRSSLLRKYFSSNSVKTVEQLLAKNGAKVITKNTIVSAKKTNDKLELLLSDGEKLTVNRLIIATGVNPNKIGSNLIPSENGLKVGINMETNLPNIYAAGDVAAAPSFFDKKNAPCPILPEAVLQGRIAGANMAGEELEYKGWIPCNYLRCFEADLFSIGINGIESGSEYNLIEKEEQGKLIRLFFKNDYLVGAEGLNQKYIHPGVFLYLVREQVPAWKYKELLLSKPRETACWLMMQHRKIKEFEC